ncbi:MAG: hypothetical protein GEU99_18725 [Luteitalea sp.]|nr:hypothetical protein [Luteitalea sp.]
MAISSCQDVFISCGCSSTASACSSSVRKFPRQLRRKLSAALKTVGTLKSSEAPPAACPRDGLDLTKSEFGLLTAFLRAPQRVLSREQLLAATRLHDEDVYDRSVDVQILRLRRKLEANPSEPELIRTERGVGYILTVPVDVL